jgi:hypothetical protein
MNQQTQKILFTAVTVLLVALVGAGGAVVYHYRNVSIDLSPTGWLPDEGPKAANKPAFPWLSGEDLKVLKDPKAANKAAYEKMSREAWERCQSQLQQGGGN